MEAFVARFSPAAIADMAATLTQSAPMVTCIAARKVSIVSSDRAIHGGELGRMKKENKKMVILVKYLENLKVSLEEENKLLKQRDLEKDNIIAKMGQDQSDNDKVIENLWSWLRRR